MSSKALTPVLDVPVEPPARVPQPTGLDLIVQRLAENPSVDVDKLERIITLQVQLMQAQAKVAFDAAMRDAQAEMRPVATDANNSQTHSRYASYTALDSAIRPIYTKHGFGVSFNTSPDAPPEHVRVLAEVTHSGGYAKHYHIDMPSDGKGAKGGDVMTKTHAAGSAVSYGMRYLLKMIFNVAVGEDDNDGNGAPKKQTVAEPPMPAGYEAWFDDMQTVAEEGTKQLTAAWNASKPEFKAFAVKFRNAAWSNCKAKAAAADKGARRG